MLKHFITKHPFRVLKWWSLLPRVKITLRQVWSVGILLILTMLVRLEDHSYYASQTRGPQKSPTMLVWLEDHRSLLPQKQYTDGSWPTVALRSGHVIFDIAITGLKLQWQHWNWYHQFNLQPYIFWQENIKQKTKPHTNKIVKHNQSVKHKNVSDVTWINQNRASEKKLSSTSLHKHKQWQRLSLHKHKQWQGLSPHKHWDS